MKRLIAMLLCVTMLCGLGTAFAAQPTQTGQGTQALGFSDLKGHWAEPALTHAVENGLLNGYDGKLFPDDLLTRAQLATIVVNAFGAAKEADISHLTDVSKDAWYYAFVKKAVSMNVLVGDNAGNFRPEANVSREEVFSVFARLLMLDDGKETALNSFTDGDQVSVWARPAAAAVVEAGLVVGNQGKLSPRASITRAEFATIMYKAIAAYGRTASVTLSQAASLAVTAPNAVVQGTKVTGDLYITEGVGNTQIILDGVTIGGRLVIRSGSVIILKNGATIAGGIVKLDGLDTEVITSDPGTGTGGSGGGGGSVNPPQPSKKQYTIEEALASSAVPEDVKQYIRYTRGEYLGVNFKVVPNVIPVGDGFNTSIFDADCNLWLGTDNGILILSQDGRTVNTISGDTDILPYDRVNMLFSDGGLGAWVICGDPADESASAVCHITDVK